MSRSWECRTARRGHNIWFRSPGRLSFPPAPPGLRPVSETPPWGFPGLLEAVSDMRTQRCFGGSSGARKTTEDGGRRCNQLGEASGVWRDRARVQDTKNEEKTRRNCVWWRDGTADGEDKLPRGRTRARASRGAVQALKSDDVKRDGRERRQSKANGGNRLGGESVRIW